MKTIIVIASIILFINFSYGDINYPEPYTIHHNDVSDHNNYNPHEYFDFNSTVVHTRQLKMQEYILDRLEWVVIDTKNISTSIITITYVILASFILCLILLLVLISKLTSICKELVLTRDDVIKMQNSIDKIDRHTTKGLQYICDYLNASMSNDCEQE